MLGFADELPFSSTPEDSMPEPAFIALPDYRECSTAKMKQRAAEFYAEDRRRRTIREYSSRQVRREIIEGCRRPAATAANGAGAQRKLRGVA
jgi:iodotyrosine deiodinase